MHYREEINLENPLGSKGEVVTHLTMLFYRMWNKSCSWDFVNPSTFKKVFCKQNAMYAGYDQHDSAEFLASLLDSLHEDVNRVKEKKYVEVPDLVGTDQ